MSRKLDITFKPEKLLRLSRQIPNPNEGGNGLYIQTHSFPVDDVLRLGWIDYVVLFVLRGLSGYLSVRIHEHF
jgi:hypothetical protein